jgi:ankyrin repeat protein
MGSHRGALQCDARGKGMIRRVFLAAAGIAAAGSAQAQFETLVLKPIVKAVREGDEEKVRQALFKGENPNQSDTNGQPLLMVAVVAGQIAVADALLKGGAVADAIDREGYTSLIRAAERGDVDIVDLLLKRNAKPSAQTRQGTTALMVASRLGFAEVVRALLEKKADPNVPDFTGRTALVFARQSGRASIEAMLRKAGGRE